ncbi:MAG TPA: YceI family protein [Caulobacter sp.]|nr:YceI family protein [Caulobacter sp.]
MFRLFAAALVAATLCGTPALAAPATDPGKMPAGTYVLEKTHASLIARVRHMGLSNYTMRFNRFEASYDWDPRNPEAARVTVTVDTTSLDVGDPKTSANFADDYLDARDHPKATFVSRQIKREGSKGQLIGDLTLRGVTRPVTLDVEFRGYDSGILGSRAGFSATGLIKRSDFGSTSMSLFAADDIELIIEVEFVRK